MNHERIQPAVQWNFDPPAATPRRGFQSMWIVRLALQRPYTFIVMSLVIVALGVLAILRMPTDIFPEIDIPIATVIWSYTGISPEEMAEVVTIRSERAFTTSVNDIEHMESQSLPGLSIIKLFFHPNAKIEAAVAQLAASSQSVLHSLPTGMTPPTIIRYNASSVPILQIGISSDTMTEQALYDYGYNVIRTQMSTVQVQIFFELVMAGHFIDLAVFLAEAQPPPFFLRKIILDSERYHGPDAGESVRHHGNDGAIAQAHNG